MEAVEESLSPSAMTNTEYHNDFTRDSSSTLKVFRDNRAKYKAIYIDRTENPPESTKDMELGTAVHSLVEPGKFAEEFVIAPERWPQNTNKGKDALAAFKAAHPGKKIIWPEDWAKVASMVAALRRDEEILELLEAPGLIEKVIHWTDAKTGVPLRCKPDKIIVKDDRVIVPDWKTVTEKRFAPADFGKQIFDFNYHCQEMVYRDGIRHWLRDEYGSDAAEEMEIDFAFIVVSKASFPKTAIYRLGDKTRQRGLELHQNTLVELAYAKTFHSWKTAPVRGIIELPPWGFVDE